MTYSSPINKGYKYTGEPVAVDGKLVTGFGLETALPLAKAVFEALKQQ